MKQIIIFIIIITLVYFCTQEPERNYTGLTQPAGEPLDMTFSDKGQQIKPYKLSMKRLTKKEN